MADSDSDSDILSHLEERFATLLESDGYRAGLEAGKKAGIEEGRALGAAEGAKRGCELGYMHGYAETYHQIQSRNSVFDSKSLRSQKMLCEVLRLIDEFPRTNETNCEEKLANIRVKFKQALVNVPQRVNVQKID